jgi:hypothetical protein
MKTNLLTHTEGVGTPVCYRWLIFIWNISSATPLMDVFPSGPNFLCRRLANVGRRGMEYLGKGMTTANIIIDQDEH